MPSRLHLEARRVSDRLEHGDPYWPAQVALAIAIVLNLALSNRVTIGPSWVIPAVEGVLLLGLIIAAPARATRETRRIRIGALVVTALVSLTNAVSVALLIKYLVDGGDADGQALLVSGGLLWVNNVLLFAVWYWELDRGGAVERFRNPDAMADFLFPQMDSPDHAPPGWRPGFVDYLYTSLTAATAFSPTDTMPLTHTAKIVMALQSITALGTIALVVARAVNVLS